MAADKNIRNMWREISRIREGQTDWFARGMDEDRFETWFQPIIDTSGHDTNDAPSNHAFVGHECLIRLRPAEGEKHRTGSDILGAAGARNDLRGFDAYARALAVRTAGRQRVRQGCSARNPFFINLLSSTIQDPEEDLRPVVELAEEAGLEPGDFVFEVVESDLVGDSARLRRVRDYLRAAGFGFALDNTGIGEDPFHCLFRLRPDYIKIDPRISWNVERPACGATVGKLVEVAGDLGARVIACGVERLSVAENLWLLGVEIMQGYFFGRPAPDVVATVKGDFAGAGARDEDLLNLARALASWSAPAAKPASAPAGTEFHQDIFLIHSNGSRRG